MPEKNSCAWYQQTGVAYLAVLFLVVTIAVSILTITQHEETLIRREKERDWLFIGQQYQQAITQYYKQSPNGLSELPMTLDDMTLDRRYTELKRYLRRVYKDPLTGENWIEVRDPEGRLKGVRSSSLNPVLLKKAVSLISGNQVSTHSDVIFEFKPEIQPSYGNQNEQKEQTNSLN